jgi:hypothetical protein
MLPRRLPPWIARIFKLTTSGKANGDLAPHPERDRAVAAKAPTEGEKVH